MSVALPKAEIRAPVRVSAVSSTGAHVARIAQHCRLADRLELWSGWRSTPEKALRYGLENSSHVWTGVANLQPFCMVGVVPENVLCGSGRIWLVATDAILDHQVAFLRRCRPLLERMQASYSVLSNEVAASNVTAVRWLEWLKFTISPAKPMGADGAMFHHFEWRRPDV